jgi:hypothetical protein
VSDDVSKGDGIQAVKNAFQGWQNVNSAKITFAYQGTTPQTDVGNDGVNLIVWADTTWDGDASTLAASTTTYNSVTGEILDDDINVNGVNYTWGVNGETDRFDIWNILAHETGHFCGLDHSSSPNATMNATAKAGETSKRYLSDDDKAGLSFLYPKSGTVGNGDIDGSGRVDGWDLFLVSLSFGYHDGDPQYKKKADLNGDGKVDGQDLAILAGNFGKNV